MFCKKRLQGLFAPAPFYAKMNGKGGGGMLRIGICDDESGARGALRLALERLLRADDEKIFYEFSSGEGTLG